MFLVACAGTAADSSSSAVSPVSPATLLARAIARSDAGLLREAIAAGADVNAPVGGSIGRCNYPLLSVIRSATPNPELVRVLLENGADPNLRTPGNAVPLKPAVCTGQIEVVRLLLEHGADWTLGGGEGGDSPWQRALLNAGEPGAYLGWRETSGETAAEDDINRQIVALFREYGAAD